MRRQSFLATIAPMWRLPHLDSGWRQQAPRWSAVALAGVIAADFGHLAWACRSLLDVRSRVTIGAPPALPHLDVQPIVSAHLFGADATLSVRREPARLKPGFRWR